MRGGAASPQEVVGVSNTGFVNSNLTIDYIVNSAVVGTFPIHVGTDPNLVYLNTETLVPVEVVQMFNGIPDPDPLLTFEVVPATPANLANLKLEIPPGFTQVPQGG